MHAIEVAELMLCGSPLSVISLSMASAALSQLESKMLIFILTISRPRPYAQISFCFNCLLVYI